MGFSARRRGRPRPARLIAVAVILLAVAAQASVASARRMSTPWRLKLFDHFDHGLSPARWGLYSGPSGGDPGGWFDPSHVAIEHGVLNLAAYQDPRFGGRWISGGLSSEPAVHQTYGKYEVRLRVDSGYGVGSDALLWPVGGPWPPEVDFAENDGLQEKRSQMHAFVHYGSTNRQVQAMTKGNFSRWHTFGVRWTPRRLVFTIDGRTWARVRGAVVPSTPMAMDIQDVAGTCGMIWQPCPNNTTPARVDLQVAWVRIYSYRP